jgi:hypothetical protein
MRVWNPSVRAFNLLLGSASTQRRYVIRVAGLFVVLAFLLVTYSALGDSPPDATQTAQPWGNLAVQFIYDGPKPEAKTIVVTKDIGAFGRFVPDESLLVGDKGGLANVAVFVTSADVPVHPEERKRAERPVELKVADGRFQPRIVSMMAGQKLKLSNDTTVAVNFLCDADFNVIVPAKDSTLLKLPKTEKSPAAVVDNIHEWLRAYLLPLDHPYAAATGADGIARLSNLPEGEWTFRFWHEQRGFLKPAEIRRPDFKIKIKPGENRLELSVTPEFVIKSK